MPISRAAEGRYMDGPPGRLEREGHDAPLPFREGFSAQRDYSLAVFLCCSSFWASMVFNIDPSQQLERLLGGTVGRYMPILLMFGSLLALFIAGMPKRTFRTPAFFAGLILFLYMLIGGIIGLQTRGILEETFVGRSLGLIAYFSGLAFAQKPTLLQAVTRRIQGVFIILSFIGIGLILMRALGLAFTQYQHILRIEQTFFVAGIALFCISHFGVFFKVSLFVLFVAISILTGKATMMLLGLLFLVLTFGTDVISYIQRHRSNPRFSSIYVVIITISVVAISALVFAGAEVIIERSARYENDLRLLMWQDLFEQFWDNPIFGSGFSDSPIYHYEHLNDLSLTSHNDILDLLVYGGVFGIILFFFILWQIFRCNTFKGLVLNEQPSRALYFFVVCCYLLSATGNPFFSTPSLAVLVWFSLGVLSVRFPITNSAAYQKSID